MDEIGVVGAGQMGSEIAFVYALGGYRVLIADQTPAILASAVERLAGLGSRGARRGFWTEEAASDGLRRITPVADIEGFGTCAMVTEAVFEELSVKAAVLKALDSICNDTCILATNTSTIPISTLAAAVGRERRTKFVGTHYFSPVSRMKLVELIAGFDTAPATVDEVHRLCVSVGKIPIRVRDVPGFAVNRVFHAFVIEAIRLVEEGVATVDDIDLACRHGLGHPMGPFELMDATTSTLCLQAQEIMFEAYGERFRPRPLLKQRVRAGLVGGKNKPGWRRH